MSGTTNFSFFPDGSTARMQPAIRAWTGATVNRIEPDPGNDGIWFMGYKVTNPSPGVWHYEYALFNENLDRAIQSFSVPLGPGVNVSNIGFHAPPQHPGWANDGTLATARVIAARRGHLPRLPIRSPGTAKRSRKTRTQMRFAGARYIISGSMPINRRKLRTRRSTSSKQDRL